MSISFVTNAIDLMNVVNVRMNHDLPHTVGEGERDFG